MGSAATMGRTFLMKLNLAGSADEEEDEEEGKDGEDCGGKEGAGEAGEAGGCGHEEGAENLAGAEGHAVHGHEGAAVFGR